MSGRTGATKKIPGQRIGVTQQRILQLLSDRRASLYESLPYSEIRRVADLHTPGPLNGLITAGLVENTYRISDAGIALLGEIG